MYVKDRRLDSDVKYEDPLVQSFEKMYISLTW
jgi:hypothetical protein